MVCDTIRSILVYLCCLVVACVPLFLYCPETKNKSLEEIGAIFGDEVTHVRLDVTKDIGDELTEKGPIESEEVEHALQK